MRTKYYWHTINNLAKFYRKVGDNAAEFWSLADHCWVWSKDANQPNALMMGGFFQPLSLREARQRAKEIGAVL